ncbi:Glyceraldehyde 3-phosphate dehydrogenase, NAD binding domain [Epsilonproteobacteria bacterium SCGC AD-308-E02]|nr:Glyceraldehyde 3-phosphate dehydrogenase, NAD binding domain [Epsilonproteobacteria bacterium SCGC AD-308-E02]
MSLKVAINGTGRIGVIVTKIVSARDDMELVAINTTSKPAMLEYLLKYDSVHKGVSAKVIDADTIEINGKNVKMFSQRDPKNIDFGGAGAEVVIECTGAFLTTEACKAYLHNGVKKVVMSAPAKDDTPTYVLNIIFVKCRFISVQLVESS